MKKEYATLARAPLPREQCPGRGLLVRSMRSRNGSGSRYSDHLSHSEADDVMHAAGSRGFAMGASNNGYARFGGNAYADEQAREERRTFRCAGCMLVAGFVLIVAGLSVMYGADYGATKARMVDGYDEIVDAWTNTYWSHLRRRRSRWSSALGDSLGRAGARRTT